MQESQLTTFEVSIAVKRARIASGLTQQQMADKLGASLAALSRWEEGTAYPSPAQIDLIESWVPGDGANQATQGVFASRGIRSRLQGFPPGPEQHLSNELQQPILERISDGQFISSAGNGGVEEIISAHEQASQTTTTPPNGGMSAGKNSYTYDAHTYHTKVPPQGIAELLEHYLPEGGLVLDPFAGSGMTGVAASAVGLDCILNELSPAATFIASRFNARVAPDDFAAAVQAVLNATQEVRDRLYATQCRECGKSTELLYTVWSYRVNCTHCFHEFQLWDHCRSYGRTVKDHRILTEFPCPNCKLTVKKSRLARTVAEPVEIGYKCCGNKAKEVNHPPSPEDLETISEITKNPPMGSLDAPKDELPDGVNLGQPRRHGITSVDKFYTARNLAAMSQLWSAIHRIEDPELAAQVAFAFTGLYRRVTKFSEFRFWGGSGNSARLNVPYIYDEANVFVAFARKARSIEDHLRSTATQYRGNVAAHVGSATDLGFIPDSSVDLVFTDPPFGANINYSEMNLLWEAWLGRKTDNRFEAIVNKVQGKDASAYGELMESALRESYRVLRPGHWMLLVFMNSSAKIWSELNDAIVNSGFVVVSADIFDKQHGTFKHFVSPNTPGADLVIHCYKPSTEGSTVLSGRTPLNLEDFLRSVSFESYKHKFMHVDRVDEPDLRRLYSEWLSKAILTGTPMIDFQEFRSVATEYMKLDGVWK